eukprot:6334673-Pyramimonas_sp.AAC.1
MGTPGSASRNTPSPCGPPECGPVQHSGTVQFSTVPQYTRGGSRKTPTGPNPNYCADKTKAFAWYSI